MPQIIEYNKYKLSRIIAIQELVSADYIEGCFAGRNYHLHSDAWELVYCSNGSAEVITGDTTITLSEAQMYLIHPGTLHDINTNDQSARILVVSFTCNTDDLLRQMRSCIMHATGREEQLFSVLMEELQTGFVSEADRIHLVNFTPSNTARIGTEQIICSNLEVILLLSLREITKNAGEIVSTDQLKKAMQAHLARQVTEYIHEHFDEPVNGETIARQFHYSRTRLAVLYKEATGQGINEALNNERIERAKELLQKGALTIAETAAKTGFSSREYFTKKFSTIVGCTPTDYIHRHVTRDE